jgi:hypothetical protein
MLMPTPRIPRVRDRVVAEFDFEISSTSQGRHSSFHVDPHSERVRQVQKADWILVLQRHGVMSSKAIILKMYMSNIHGQPTYQMKRFALLAI